MQQQLIAPIPEQERFSEIDILRGFAVFGILLVNMMFFAWPSQQEYLGAPWTSWFDRAADILIRFFATSKFYVLFSFLFGTGLALQLQRAETRGANLRPIYRRRLMALLLIGLMHGLLIWYGDILTFYAGVGLLLALFQRRQQKTVLIWAAALFLLTALIPLLLYGYNLIAPPNPKPAGSVIRQEESFHKQAVESTKDYAGGTFGDVQRRRTMDFVQTTALLPYFVPQFLGLFLLGLYIGRRGILQNVAANMDWIRKVRNWTFFIGLIGNAIWVTAWLYGESHPGQRLVTALGRVCGAFSPAGLAFFYASQLLLLLQQDSWRRRLLPLASVGRMALTNYLMQSILCTSIFYSYGLALFGRIGPAAGLAIAVVIYALQVPLSAWWLGRFRFGPAEWFWRCLTYGSLQPMRRGSQPAILPNPA